MTNRITVLLVDDHSVVRQGVRAFLEVQKDLHIVGEASTGEEAIRLVQDIVPDVVLMDLMLPGMNGIEATRQIKRISPSTNVVVLTSYHDDEDIFPALRAGATSYTLKDIRSTELAEIIRKAAHGESVLHSQVANRVIQEVREARRAVPPVFVDLTERELDVLRLIAEGFSNTAIAEKLVISEKTVKGHVSNILNKLHIEDRTQAAVLAWRQGLMEL
ncbi:two-component system, NarL family, response regulator LiaR [Thermosporothrix hazakensis]|jgi:NarL family two-component system response regulator LiaR|uniref:Two-component system, NarL family, response regulator LiaR n=2 Tax=Thermosporothrix TaxID=768650 RepID=A0A326UDS8_THEHA|nr:response regulator transcription factor [Thermosporothrix hazakensis]PZW27925.1 two-component system, NarL family, response regulator LiaR [Thermosporothrix hazakensis]BBH86854.1 DNA-binding response regulator [Thermosporothrix sp. COM3]GCE51150.1 DNA-binding response regulator [Thermosporothrix hazakensis]